MSLQIYPAQESVVARKLLSESTESHAYMSREHCAVKPTL